MIHVATLFHDDIVDDSPMRRGWPSVKSILKNKISLLMGDYFFSQATQGVDFRAKNIEAFNSIEKNSIDFYASVKSLYLQDRERKIFNSEDITETLDDSDWDEIEIK